MNHANAVVPLHPGSTEPAPRNAAAEEAWFKLARHPWKTLLLVPTPGADVAQLARDVVGVAARSGAAVQLLDARRGSVEELAGHTDALRTSAREGLRSIVLVDAPTDGPGALALETVSDAAVLCVTRGVARMDEAKQTVAAVGANRFIGSLLLF